MQSDGNSFYGNVVLDSFNMAYSDDQKYESKSFLNLYFEDFK